MGPKFKLSARNSSQSRSTIIAVFIVISLCVLWITAVVNVLMLSYHKSSVEDVAIVRDLSSSKGSSNKYRPPGDDSKNKSSRVIISNGKDNDHERKDQSNNLRASNNIRLKNHLSKSKRNETTIKISSSRGDSIKKLMKVKSLKIKETYELKWPPVQDDGNISDTDGYDIMPLTGLKVPRFWSPKPSEDWNKIGTRVNKLPTIFMMIASYRDYQCHETITSAYQRSDHPERLFVGAVQQDIDTDLPCKYTEISCEVDPNQPICKYKDQISVYRMHATMATGPVTARHIGDRLYRGQYFVTQMDAHCVFVNHWDTQLIRQWESTHNEMAVLTSYLTDLQGSIDANGDSTRDTRPIMCNSDFEGEGTTKHLRHGTQPESYPSILDMPQLEPFWAAGFSFSRGHFKVRVPYDAYQPMVFQGEEISIGVRGFTHGYDYYAPRASVVFHEYAEASKRREKVPTFWENSELHVGEADKSLKRSMSLIQLAPGVDSSEWDHTEEERYGLGKVRDVKIFYRIFLIDHYVLNRSTTVPLCPFVDTGYMHRDFMPHLRPDGLGIDYNTLQSYDTREFFASRTTDIPEELPTE